MFFLIYILSCWSVQYIFLHHSLADVGYLLGVYASENPRDHFFVVWFSILEESLELLSFEVGLGNTPHQLDGVELR
jgi:hypothetical protein